VFNQVMGESPRAFRRSMRPIVERMLKRVPQDLSGIPFAPKYVDRKEEEVLFVRKVGPYAETPWQGFNDLLAFLNQEKVSKEEIKAFYSMGLDDPHFVPLSKCRFDACVALKKRHIPKGEVGLKILPGGKCAVFVHKGSYNEIEAFFQKIFTTWYPTANITLADVAPFCEHLELGDERIPMAERITHLYIPLEE
jgi:AraC family transcriptional regulator